ncbi:hypothetical protein JZ751_021833 [Albula glossodonta]|uniref:Uncharacterized protein n=1 Tax=Albula glossodonta TaxID=121402 RepID=A0A8T2N2S9_9TELE|nr:hypothetical protein JZ751_021833 [Albula glossodonta]
MPLTLNKQNNQGEFDFSDRRTELLRRRDCFISAGRVSLGFKRISGKLCQAAAQPGTWYLAGFILKWAAQQ